MEYHQRPLLGCTFFSALSCFYLSYVFLVDLAIFPVCLCVNSYRVFPVAVCWIYCSSFVRYQCVVVCVLWLDLNVYLLLCLLLPPPKLLLFSNTSCIVGHSTCDFHVCCNVSELTPCWWPIVTIFFNTNFMVVLGWCLFALVQVEFCLYCASLFITDKS